MKTLFIEAKYTGKIDVSKIKIKKLPDKIGLATTVQFVDFLDEIKSYLESKGKEVVICQGKQVYPGQILGCEQSSAVDIRWSSDAILYVGDGFFHPIGIALKTKKNVYRFNPITGEFLKIDKKDIEKIKMKRKSQLLRFHSSTEIGVIISVKPGQNKLREAKKLEEKYPDKNFYFILFDDVDFSELENFNFIQSWVNTSCPRIEEDIKVINLEDL